MLNFTLFSDKLDYALGWMVVHSLWQATLIAIVSGIVMIALRKKSAKLRYVLSNISLLAVLVAAVITFAMHYDFGATPKNTVSNHTLNIIESDATPSLAENTEGVIASTESEPPKALFNLSTFKEYFNNHLPLIVTLWLLGVALFLLRLMGSVSYIYYLKNRMNFPTDEYWTEMVDNLSQKAGLKQAVDLVESAMVRTPVVVGFLKPMILFPMGVINRLAPEEVEAILAHELAHVLRHDYIFNIFQSIVEALFYYHPAVWWLSGQIRNERESACDDIAINLINSKMNYAKALVTIQEMSYYPMNPLAGFVTQNVMTQNAFTGQKKNQFVMRMHRILNVQQNKTNVMEKLIATLLIVCALFGLTYGQKQSEKTPKVENLSQNDDTFIQIEDSDRPLSMKGLWQAELIGNEVCIGFNNNLKGGNWNSTECFDRKELSDMPTEEKEFTIKRASGTMILKGKFEGNEGYGRFTFTENTEFKTYLESQGATGLKESTMLHCFFADMDKDFIGFMNQKGYSNLNRRQIEELAIFRMDKNTVTYYLGFFKKNSTVNPPLKKLVELKIHGIDKEYISTLQKYGFIDVPINQVLEAKIHGIDDEYLTSFVRTKKDKRYSLQDLIQMKIHGADGDFVAKLEGNTGKTLDADDVVNSKIHNIDRIDVDKIEKSTGDKLDRDDLQSFAIHGIDADYIEKVNSMGLGKLSPDNIVAAKIHGITPEFIKEYTSLGFKKLNFDDIVSAKIHGVNSESVRKFKEMGFNVKFDDVVAAKIHGLTPEFMQQLKQSGFTDISFDDAIGFKIHGVNGDFVKGFKDMGFKDASMDDLMACKIHGVTPQYLKSFEAAGIKNLDIDDAVAFKIHGVTPDFVKSLKEKGYDIEADEVLNKKIRGTNNKGGSRSFNNNNKPNVDINLGDLNINLGDLKIDEKAIEKTIEKAVSSAVSSSPMGSFMKLLVKDNLVKLNKKVVIKANKNWLTVDGKKLDDAQFQKYKTQVESKQERPLSKDFRFGFEGLILEVVGDNLRIKGSIETDDN
jgi:beta-lactamase regulating signal transducer with metallopeptidase domain